MGRVKQAFSKKIGPPLEEPLVHIFQGAPARPTGVSAAIPLCKSLLPELPAFQYTSINLLADEFRAATCKMCITMACTKIELLEEKKIYTDGVERGKVAQEIGNLRSLLPPY